MEAIRVQHTIKKKGEITIQNLPVEEGQEVEILLLITPENGQKRPRLTAKKLLDSGLVGIWKDREEIRDSSEFARQLREKAQNRLHLTKAIDDNSG
jgi:hypothetical protein